MVECLSRRYEGCKKFSGVDLICIMTSSEIFLKTRPRCLKQISADLREKKDRSYTAKHKIHAYDGF